MTGKTVSPSAEAAFDKRREVATQVLRAHFPSGTQKSVEDNALLLATGIAIWGEIVPTLKHAQKVKLDQIVKELSSLSSDAPYWLRKELTAALQILDTASQAHSLHGRQNVNEMATKVQLVNICRQIWFGQHKEEAPVSFQQESHPFSRFVSDVIADVFLKDWSPQSAIEAYKNCK
ncbi:MAG: hypothetical protein OSB34_14645 [Planktomarina sp.]|nr:hypothetical protein [Planktomarina sp.]